MQDTLQTPHCLTPSHTVSGSSFITLDFIDQCEGLEEMEARSLGTGVVGEWSQGTFEWVGLLQDGWVDKVT